MTLLKIEYGGRVYAGWDEAALRQAGVPQAAIDAGRDGERREAIRAECRRRIYAVASTETQMNMASLAAVIGAKSPEARSAEEAATLAAFGASLAWVQAMREAVGDLVADPNADPASDASWPPCPEAAVALFARF